jgi:hypothetical protein
MGMTERALGFATAEQEHLRSFRSLSAVQKLAWLQQAKEFCAKYLGAAQSAGQLGAKKR